MTPQMPREIHFDSPIAISESNHEMMWHRCAHWARVQPQKPAIVTDQGRFTFEQLHGAVNRIAREVLRARDSLDGSALRVLLLYSDPFEHAAAMMGVEKAGACHIPLNISSPDAFLSQIAAEVEPGLILTESPLSDRARMLRPASVPVLCTDMLETTSDVPAGACTLDDLHCILYTSGSSGRPKGVIHNRYFEAFTVARDLASGMNVIDDRVLAASAISWGLGYRYLRNAVTVGATLYSPNMHGDWLATTRRWLATEQITYLGTLPSLMRALFDGTESIRPIPGIQIVSISGEPVLSKDIELFRRFTEPGTLLNVVFGASEGGIYCSRMLGHESESDTQDIPLGKLVGFVELAIVDEQLNPLPTGTEGEMVFRSPMTADGYWKMPELSATKFLPDPEGGRRRRYRTGDLGRLNADGSIRFLGRMDDELKINGNRVSLPLIENALRECPGVRNVTVQAQPRPGDGSTCLAAYYVPTGENAATLDGMREHLRQRLPPYMTPAYFIRMETMPLNANGKVDRRGLPKPAEADRPMDGEFVAARTEVEQKIAAVWRRILGVREVGMNDRFFDLGGDSLQAVRMLIQVNKDLGTTLDIPALNQVRTVGEMAGLIGVAGSHRYPPYMLLREGKGTPLFLFHAIGGNVLVYQSLAARLKGDRPVYGILAMGLNQDETPLHSVPEIAARHIRVMKSIQPHGPYYFGGYSFGGICTYEVAQQLRAAGEQVGLMVVIDARVHLPKERTFLQRCGNRVSREMRRVTHHVGYFATHRPSEWVPYGRELLRRAKRVRRNVRLRERQDAGFHEQVDRYLDEVDKVATPAIRRTIDANHLAVGSYRPVPYEGNVVVMLASDTNFEGPAAWRAPWREAVKGKLEFFEVPGDHRNMLQEPQVDVLAERLNAVVEAAFARAKKD